MICPHDHGRLLGTYHQGNALHVEKAIEAANAAKSDWSRMPWDSRAIVLLKAADLLAGKKPTDAHRRHHAEHEHDAAPSRNRRGLRVD